jgi:phosphate transport system substrate-binding protein
MIDMGKAARIDSPHFVNRAAVRWFPSPVWLACVCSLLAIAGCTTRTSTPDAVEDTQTSGRISIVAGPELEVLMSQQTAAFQAMYPQASFSLRADASPRAVAELLAGRADVAAVPRELDRAERAAAVGAGIELEGYLVGRSALAAIVHSDNPVENLSRFELAAMLNGGLRRWDRIGGRPGAIVPVLPSLTGETSLALAHMLLDSGTVTVPSVVVEDDSAVIARVRREPTAIGFIDASRLGADGVRALRISALDGLRYVRPDAQTIHEGTYPLIRSLHLYIRSRGPRLAGGFVTFVTSNDGQRLVLDAGFVPTSVPVRFVRRSPMQRSH